jgi:hypothetical protein
LLCFFLKRKNTFSVLSLKLSTASFFSLKSKPYFKDVIVLVGGAMSNTFLRITSSPRWGFVNVCTGFFASEVVFRRLSQFRELAFSFQKIVWVVISVWDLTLIWLCFFAVSVSASVDDGDLCRFLSLMDSTWDLWFF